MQTRRWAALLVAGVLVTAVAPPAGGPAAQGRSRGEIEPRAVEWIKRAPPSSASSWATGTSYQGSTTRRSDSTPPADARRIEFMR